MASEPIYRKESLSTKKQEVAATFQAFDENDKRSLINIVPLKVRDAIIDFLDPNKPGDIRWLSWSERQLERELRKVLAAKERTKWERYQIPALDVSIRIGFWNEYERAQATKTRMTEMNVLRGITYPEMWWSKLKEPMWLAWLISAPRSLAVQQEEVLNQCYKLLREVVRDRKNLYEEKEVVKIATDGKETRTKTKKLNTSAVALLQKISEDLANRVQGAVVQKHMIAAHVQNNQQALPTDHTQRLPQAESREDLEREIQDLEADNDSVIEAEIDDGGRV